MPVCTGFIPNPKFIFGSNEKKKTTTKNQRNGDEGGRGRRRRVEKCSPFLSDRWPWFMSPGPRGLA